MSILNPLEMPATGAGSRVADAAATSRRTLRALAALLEYPGADLRAAAPELAAALAADAALTASRREELAALASQIGEADPFLVEERYVDTFDRGRATSLHLFEHVHGDSRDRGPAMVDLAQTYERAGLHLEGRELPDHLGVVLEFASTQPMAVAREFLGEMAHILLSIFSALRERRSPYASVVAAVLELAGQDVQPVPVEPDPALDEAWAEPPAFGGCNAHGQSAPAAPQPIQIVRRTATRPDAPTTASAAPHGAAA